MFHWILGPVVQSIISLTSSLRVISWFNIQYSDIFCWKKYQHICVSLNVNFNESLTNDIVSFEKLGPDHQNFWVIEWLASRTLDLEVPCLYPAGGGIRWFIWMRLWLVIRRMWVLPPQGRQYSFVEINHFIFSTVFLSLLLIQEGSGQFLAKDVHNTG